jgi:lipoyl(octanoyl) transferase
MSIRPDTLYNNTSNPWRLLKTPASSAAYNMALDEALLLSVAQKKSLPTLRLYSWKVPSLSLGYAQPVLDVDQTELARQNWQMVRRPTGGKAILHTDELTYSITASLDEPLVAGSLLESYQRISQALQKALQLLGTPTSAENKPDHPPAHSKKEPVCFQTPSDYEITWNGKKLIGSAQARKMGGVLQHGSLPLQGDLSRITRVLTYPSELDRDLAAQKTLAQATTLEAAAGRIISWEDAADAIILSFTTEFGIAFIAEQPTQEEMELSDELMKTKYGSDSWNFRI